jgi:hypothetical protein
MANPSPEALAAKRSSLGYSIEEARLEGPPIRRQ